MPRATPWAATGSASSMHPRRRNVLPATLFMTLYGWTRYVAVRTEHATITRLGAQHGAATGAFMEEHASVFGHGFHAAVPAMRTHERASKDWGFRVHRLGGIHDAMLRPGTIQHHARTPATNCRSSVRVRDFVQHRRTAADMGWAVLSSSSSMVTVIRMPTGQATGSASNLPGDAPVRAPQGPGLKSFHP